MIQCPVAEGDAPNQLWDIVERLRNEDVRALNKFGLSLFDPVRDVDNSPYGGQCLSFMSFKVIPGSEKTLTLTAMYRNHFYIEKLLGNLIGLGRLMEFVAHETGLKVGGPRTVELDPGWLALALGQWRSWSTPFRGSMLGAVPMGFRPVSAIRMSTLFWQSRLL